MDGDNTVIYLMGPSELDRIAYRLLLQHELSFSVELESDFSAVGVWGAMRMQPTLALVTADRASAIVRDALQMIPRLCKRTRILAVSTSVTGDALKDWSACGLAGYIFKDAGIAELGAAIKAVCAGREYFSAGVSEAIKRGRKANHGLAALSPRENELFPLIATGLTLREAAAAMTVSYKTADSYRTSLMRKLAVRDRVELARLAIREHIIEA